MRSWIYKWSGYERILKLLRSEVNQSADAFIRKGISEFAVSSTRHGVPLTEMRSTVFLSNHHTGLLDFLAAYPVLAPIAPQLKIIVNRQIRRLTPMQEATIGVYPVSSGVRNFEAQDEMIRHLRSGGNLLLYPAGKVARATGSVIEDCDWRLGSAAILQRHAENVVPIYVDAQNSRFFYRVRKWFPRLHLLFILRELHTRRAGPTPVYVGNPIPRSELQSLSAQGLMKFLRDKVYNLKDEVRYVRT